MNYTQLQQEVFDSGLGYLNDAGTGLLRVQRWINQAYLEVCATDNWSFLETNLVTAAPVTISDLARVLVVLDTTNDVALEQSEYTSLLNGVALGDVTTTGLPQYWYLSGFTLSVFPVSTLSLSIRYIKTPAELSSPGDTPVIPTEFHDLIVLGAWRRGLLDDQDAGDMALVKGEWNERVQMMREKYLPRFGSQLITYAAGDW
jgi:hypothetical protein